MAVAAQVIACQIDQHDVLGILFRVVAQKLRPPAVGFGISCAACRSGDGIDVCLAALNAAMGLRTGTENAESAEIEVEQIGRGIDAAQRPV